MSTPNNGRAFFLGVPGDIEPEYGAPIPIVENEGDDFPLAFVNYRADYEDVAESELDGDNERALNLARTLAAAPALAEALRDTLAELERIGPDETGNGPERYLRTVERAHAALLLLTP